MAFMNNMRDRISHASQTTVQKAKDLSEIAKLTATIASSEKQVNELYNKIGSEIYRTYSEAPLPEVEELIKQVAELHQTIENCRSQIKVLNAPVVSAAPTAPAGPVYTDVCPTCGAKVSQDMLFCCGCGNKLPEKVAQPAPVPGTCPNCGAAVPEGAAFCISCGLRLSNP